MIYSPISAPMGAAKISFAVYLVSDRSNWVIVDPTQAAPVSGRLFLIEGGRRPAALKRLGASAADKNAGHIERPIVGGSRRIVGRVVSWGSSEGL